MCLIIHRPSGVKLPSDWTENALVHNPDGWGIMTAVRGKIVIKRGLDASKFASALNPFGGMEVFIHFRNSTHGAKNVKNCHPFSIVDGTHAAMHNGIIDIDTNSDKAMSDTWHFCNHVLDPILRMNESVLSQGGFLEAIETMIGTANKVVVMKNDGSFAIANRDQGVERDGCWLSNTYSIEPVRTLSRAFAYEWTEKFSFREFRSLQEPIDDSLDYRDASLKELAELSTDDLAEWCETCPREVAQAIQEHFDWTGSDYDYR